MNGFRFQGNKHVNLTNHFIKRLNKLQAQKINAKELCKFLKIPVIFYLDHNGQQRIRLKCNTKNITGYISRLEEFLRS